MIDKINDDGSVATKTESIAIHVSASGATAYMNRAALKKLVERLTVISDADPRECYEIHLCMFFSYFNVSEELVWPNVRYSDGLADVFSKITDESLRTLINDGELPADAEVSPFELTIMHVWDEAIQEEMDRENS